MQCAACPKLAERHCPQCKRGFCAAHNGHTQNGSLHWCPMCTRPRYMVYLEKFGDAQIGMALALPGEPMFTGDKSEENEESERTEQ